MTALALSQPATVVPSLMTCPATLPVPVLCMPRPAQVPVTTARAVSLTRPLPLYAPTVK